MLIIKESQEMNKKNTVYNNISNNEQLKKISSPFGV